MLTQYYTATTLDGYIADPDHSLDWLLDVPSPSSLDERFERFLTNVGALVMGASTYLWILDHENLLDGPAAWQRFYGERPTFVVTHRDLPVVPGVDLRFVQGDARQWHAQAAEAAAGGNVWMVGGGDLAGQLADVGLLDELVIGVAPATLGAGAPLLPRRIRSERLRLAAVEQEGAFAMLTYRLAPPS